MRGADAGGDAFGGVGCAFQAHPVAAGVRRAHAADGVLLTGGKPPQHGLVQRCLAHGVAQADAAVQTVDGVGQGGTAGRRCHGRSGMRCAGCQDPALQRAPQQVRFDRLADVVAHPCFQTAFAVLGHHIGAHGDDGKLRKLANFARGGETVHDRHLHVHQHRVECRGPHHAYRNGAVVGQFDLQTGALQQLACHFLVQVVVFHHQDAGAGQGAQRQRRTRRWVRGVRWGAGLGNADPGGEPKRAALPRLGTHADLAVHQRGQVFGNRQTQSGAAVLARGRGVGLLEGLEQLQALLRRQANAGVAHFAIQQHLVVGVFAHVQGDGDAALGGELDGVVGVVDQDLAQAQRVAQEPVRHVGVDLRVQFESLGLRLLGNQVAHAG